MLPKPASRQPKTLAIIEDLRITKDRDAVAKKYGISPQYAYMLQREEGLIPITRRKKLKRKPKAKPSASRSAGSKIAIPTPVPEPAPAPVLVPVVVHEPPPMPPRLTLWQRVKAVFAPA